MQYGFLLVGLLVVFCGVVLKSQATANDKTMEATPIILTLAGVTCFVLAYLLHAQ